MVDHSKIKITDYTYELPDSRIAKYPLDQRDQSKLLLWKRGEISDHSFREIDQLLPAGSLLVFNNTKVIRARMYFQKETGARVELFLLEPIQPADYLLNFQQNKQSTWKCLVGNSKKWKSGFIQKKINIQNEQVTVFAQRNNEKPGEIEFSWNNKDITFAQILEEAGNIPIPPYLNRETEKSDLERYQTIYSKIKGSVAAPTAGLHFTEKVFDKIKEVGHKTMEVTLHVGAGTFQPVKSESIDEHEMHTEHIEITREILEKLINKQSEIIAVGTTSIRTLESLYWMGVKTLLIPDLTIEQLHIEQQFAYTHKIKYSKKEALGSLLRFMQAKDLDRIKTSTQIIIVPGYNFKIIDGMITNFHQPQSTLLLLISAFTGDDWKTIYKHAMDNDYRFLSYGDSNLYLK